MIFMKKYLVSGTVFAFVIITVASSIVLLSSRDDSFTVDEIPHVGAGYSYLMKRDMRLNPEHPVLAKDLAAFPLLFLKLDTSVFETPQWTQEVNGQWNVGSYFLFGSQNNPDGIKFWTKLPMILFFILSACIIFVWTRSLYNAKAALLATTIFCFSPTVMAHARVVHFDSAATFGALCAIYFFTRYLSNQTKKNFFFAVCALGIALLTKFSLLLLIPFIFLLVGIYKEFNFKCTAKAFLIILCAYIFIVFPAYAFHVSQYPKERQLSDTKQLLMYAKPSIQKSLVIWMADKPILRAGGQYGLGVLLSFQRMGVSDITYFLGKTSDKGSPYYFPTVYFLKEPLAWWILALFACGFALWKLKKKKYGYKTFLIDNRNNFGKIAIALWIILYWLISIIKGPNIGVRYLLPVYPFMIILVSGQISNWFTQIQKNKNVYMFSAGTLAVLLGWYVVENARIYPLYFTYFNQVAGGSAGGYRYAVDSNLDWGQDLIRLSNWVSEKNIKKIEFSYFGWANPTYYLGDRGVVTYTNYKDEQDFKKQNQTDGWIAVSANFLQWEHIRKDQQWPYYGWIKKYTPVTVIGNSIFVYQIK